MIDLKCTPEQLIRLAQLDKQRKRWAASNYFLEIRNALPALLSDLETMKREIERLTARLFEAGMYDKSLVVK